MSYCLNLLSNEWSLTTWHANFRPTGKNNQVEKFLIAFGFSKLKPNDQVYQAPMLQNFPIIEYIKISEDPLS